MKIILAVGVVIALVSLVVMITMTPSPKIKANQFKDEGIVNQNEDIGGDFVLTDIYGKIIDSKDFRGKLLLIYFGFTYCPDICPASLYEMTKALDELKGYNGEIQAIFITVDPQRDTKEQLKEYFDGFDKRILPLTGTVQETDAVAKKFRVYYAKAADDKRDTEHYLINHSSFYYLVSTDGMLIKYYPSGISGVDMGKDIGKYLKR